MYLGIRRIRETRYFTTQAVPFGEQIYAVTQRNPCQGKFFLVCCEIENLILAGAKVSQFLKKISRINLVFENHCLLCSKSSPLNESFSSKI